MNAIKFFLVKRSIFYCENTSLLIWISNHLISFSVYSLKWFKSVHTLKPNGLYNPQERCTCPNNVKYSLLCSEG